MEIHVQLFAGLRQAAGFKERTVTLEPGSNVTQLLTQLQAELTGLDLLSRTFYVAVNQEYANRETPLADGDEVALLPPVSGGGSNTW